MRMRTNAMNLQSQRSAAESAAGLRAPSTVGEPSQWANSNAVNTACIIDAKEVQGAGGIFKRGNVSFAWRALTFSYQSGVQIMKMTVLDRKSMMLCAKRSSL